MRWLSRISFSARLLLAAALVTAALVTVDYVTLLELPSRVARDSVEVALRENAQTFNTAITDERTVLRREVDEFVARPAVRAAIRNEDVDALSQYLPELGPAVQVRFQEPDQLDGAGLGVVAVERPVDFNDGVRNVVFFREISDELLERAAADAGESVAFAVERDGAFVARSRGFSRDIQASFVNPGNEPSAGLTEDIEVDGDALHIYSRRMVQDTSYQVHTLSTPGLEDEALGETRSDVRNAILGMTAATLLGFVLIAAFTSRSVRRFSRRVKEMADGDYGGTLPVRGRDGFADLADSVNRLSSDLEHRMRELRTSASAFRRTLETLEEGICTWSEAGEVEYWNRGAEQLTGVPRERASIDDPVVQFLHAERTPGVRRVTLPVRRSGSGGLAADLVVTAMPGGGVLQTFRDTTMADVLQQTQRNFMATAAHELRTPITTILGFADTLSNEDLELTERQRAEFVGIIRDQSHHLQDIADAFFTNHQLANERVEVSVGPAHLVSVVASALERVRHSQPDRVAQIDEIALEVPADVVVLADRRALTGAISVLVENALKYGSAPITVGAERVGGTVALLVRDEGVGIEPYHQGRIFDPFYRIDVDMRSGVGGAGLGLFTARKLVEAMHGLVRVRSTPGAGTTFLIELPAAPSGAELTTGDDEPGLRLVM